MNSTVAVGVPFAVSVSRVLSLRSDSHPHPPSKHGVPVNDSGVLWGVPLISSDKCRVGCVPHAPWGVNALLV